MSLPDNEMRRTEIAAAPPREERTRDGLQREVKRLRKVLADAAAHHEDQARAWGGVEDESNEAYHARRAKVLHAARDGKDER